MSDIMQKKLKSVLKKNFFRRMIALLVIIFILNVFSIPAYQRNKPKEIIKGYVDNNFTELIKDQSKKSTFKITFDLSIIDDPKNVDFILTSDINSIDTTIPYKTLGYTPLILLLNKKTAESVSKSSISLEKDDFYTCNFKAFINAVLNNQGWKSLGREDDNKITVYCPKSDTVEGKLFYNFLLISINDGKYPTENLEEIKQKADEFLSSPNLIQTDVVQKVLKLDGNLNTDDIYILFESDLIKNVLDNISSICPVYPNLTVVKKVYLQYIGKNNGKLQNILDGETFLRYGIQDAVFANEYYRTESHRGITSKVKTATGINYYELEVE